MRKIIFTVFLLFISINMIEASFPSSFSSVSYVPHYADGSKYTITKGAWKTILKQGTFGNQSYVLICSDYYNNPPTDQTCSKTSGWDDATKAAVASIINSAGGSFTTIDVNYLKASITITEFQTVKAGVSVSKDPYCYVPGSWTNDSTCPKNWYDTAVSVYDAVKNAESNISVSIGTVTYTEDDTAFYLTIPITDDYNTSTSVSVSHSAVKQTNGTYKILKSDLSEGANTITITAKAVYETDIAENYGCGSGYQSVTPAYTESAVVAEDTDTETVTLTKKSNYEVIYHGNGGYDSSGHSIIYDYATYDSDYTVKSGDIFDFNDHTFLGWTTNPDGETDDGYNWTGWSGKWVYDNGQYGINNNELHLYARWIDSCIYYFNRDSSIKNRLKLYKDYGRKNLLNFKDKTTAEAACSLYEPEYDSNETCLHVNKVSSTTQSKFNYENLSDYNDTIKSSSNDIVSYCLTNFKLNSSIGIKNYIKAGRLAYGDTYRSTPIHGTIEKTCYIHEDDILNYGIATQYDYSYIPLINADTKYTYYINMADYQKIKQFEQYYIFKYADPNIPSNYLTISRNFIDNKYRLGSDSYYFPSANSASFNFLNFNNDRVYSLIPQHVNQNTAYDRKQYILFYDVGTTGTKNYYLIHNSIINNYVLNGGKYIHRNNSTNVQEGHLENLFSNLYANNIGDVYLNNQRLYTITTPLTTSIPVKKGEFYKISGTVSAIYELNPVYAQKLSGKECLVGDDDCSLIGYGIFSKFVDSKDSSSQGSFNFKVTPGNNSIFKYDVNNKLKFAEEGHMCTYRVTPEIIKYNNDNGKLNLEFRTIDTNNPFNRTTKTNWSNGTDNSQNNKIVQDEIINETNSYGIKNGVGNQTPKYTIILTPDIVADIRDDNIDNPYDEYYKSCTVGSSCMSKSQFIHDLYLKGVIK